jgi:hypothetical protein
VTDPGRYAVIPTRDRPAELAAVAAALHAQDVRVIVVDNGSDPPADVEAAAVIVDYEQPPNLSRLWNLGINLADKLASDAGQQFWDVAVVNDDAVIPDGWYTACSRAMRSVGAMAASSDPHGRITTPLVKTSPDRDVYTRMCGWAFLLRGEGGLRADEDLRWWWGDTGIDWEARRAGGAVLIPGFPVSNRHANFTTRGALAAQAGQDRATFEAKWGPAPW